MLPQVQHLCRPPSIALIAAWCRKISPHLPRAPLDEQAVLVAVQGFAVACCDLPYAVWTGESATEALRTYKWWPTPAEVLALLDPRRPLHPAAGPADGDYRGGRSRHRTAAQAARPHAGGGRACRCGGVSVRRRAGFQRPCARGRPQCPGPGRWRLGICLRFTRLGRPAASPGRTSAAQRAALIRSEMIWANEKNRAFFCETISFVAISFGVFSKPSLRLKTAGRCAKVFLLPHLSFRPGPCVDGFLMLFHDFLAL